MLPAMMPHVCLLYLSSEPPYCHYTGSLKQTQDHQQKLVLGGVCSLLIILKATLVSGVLGKANCGH